jgi:hypothetical protein
MKHEKDEKMKNINESLRPLWVRYTYETEFSSKEESGTVAICETIITEHFLKTTNDIFYRHKTHVIEAR